MTHRRALVSVILCVSLLTTLWPVQATEATVASRAPLVGTDIPAFNYSWEHREVKWLGWRFQSYPGDKDHLFFIYDNKVMLMDLTDSTVNEVANITYKLTTDPNGPDHSSTLLDIKATRLDDGRYHLALMENQYDNNQTAQYLVLMIVNSTGSLVKWSRPVGTQPVEGYDLERALCVVIARNITLNQHYFIWWNKFNNDTWNVNTLGTGQGAPGATYVVSIAYNTSSKFYTVNWVNTGNSYVDIVILNINGGGQGIGGYAAQIDPNWGIISMDTVFDCEGKDCRYVMGVMEQNRSDHNSFRVEYLKNVDSFQVTPTGPLVVYDNSSNPLIPWANWNTNIAITAADGVVSLMFLAIPSGIGGGITTPSFITTVFLHRDGTILGNATYQRLADGHIGSLMVGHDIYVGGGRETTGGAQPPHWIFFIDKVTPKFFGDWGLSDLNVMQPASIYGVNESQMFTFNATSRIPLLNMSWMQPCHVNFSIDGVELNPGWPPLDAGLQIPRQLGAWMTTHGRHNISVAIEVPMDLDWSNNSRWLLISVEFPDLALTNLTVVPTVFVQGASLNLSYDIYNLGANLSSGDVWFTMNHSTYNYPVSNLGYGFHGHFSKTLYTSNYPLGTLVLTLHATPKYTNDENWSNNNLTLQLRIYNPRINLVVDSPKEHDTVSRTLTISGHIYDPENETVSVHAELKAGTYKNTTAAVQIKNHDTFEFHMNISKVIGNCTVTVFANGTLGRHAVSIVNTIVKNGPYWDKLDPAVNTTVMKENTTMNFTAVAADWGTDSWVKINWTVDGKDATALKEVKLPIKDIIPGQGPLYWDLLYTPGYDGAGIHLIKAEAFNPFGRISHSWTVNVTDVNRPPQVTNVTPTGTVRIVLGGYQNFTASATDPDGDTLNYTWVIGQKTFFGPAMTFKPEAAGNSTMVLYVSDGKNTTVHEWPIVVVTKGPPPPHNPVKYNTTVQSPWLPWVIVVVVIAVSVCVVAYFIRRERPPSKAIKSSNK